MGCKGNQYTYLCNAHSKAGSPPAGTKRIFIIISYLRHMAYNVHVFLRNSDFSQEFADEQHNGEESPENIRHEWEDEFRITGTFSKVEVLRDQTYELKGDLGDDRPFSYQIPGVTSVLFHAEDGATSLIFSEKALEEYILDTEKHTLEVYLNDDEVVENPLPGVYIVLSDFPKELRN
jgi:hypothetical protein